MPGGQAFNRRFCNATFGKYKSYNHVNITKAMKLGMQIWLKFLTKLNVVI